MKKAIRLSLITVLYLLSSCHPNKIYHNCLVKIDSLTYHYPDSAIICLDKLSDSIKLAPLEMQMYHQLLTVKAKDKAYITHESDSLILQIISYFEKQKNTHLLPEAYYYAGRVYSDLYDAPKALEYFQKAAEILKESPNFKLLKVIYSQMGHLLLYQNVYNEAMEAFKKAYQYNILAGDIKGGVVDCCWIGETFTGYGNADSAMFYLHKAYQDALSINDNDLKNQTKLYLADLYRQLGKHDSIRTIFSDYNGSRKAVYHEIWGDMYRESEQLDSASYCYHKMLEDDYMHTNQEAHFKLAEIAMKKGDAKEVMEHIRQYKEWTAEIAKVTNSETIHKMHSFYNYQLREKENNRLRLKNARQEKLNTISIFTILLLASFIFIYIQYSKRKRALLNIRLEKLESLKEEQYQKSAQFIEDNKQKIEELEQQLRQSVQESDDMKALLRAQKEQIQQMNCKVEADKEERQLAETVFRQSEIYNKFHHAANDENVKLTSQDWETLRTQTDNCYQNFTSKLRSLYPISDMEMRICLLLKIGISITGISLLCGRTKSAIVSARKRLYEKVYMQKGKPEEWDEFIRLL